MNGGGCRCGFIHRCCLHRAGLFCPRLEKEQGTSDLKNSGWRLITIGSMINVVANITIRI